MPQDFPNVEDAVRDYQQSVFCIVEEIANEYQRMFQGDEESSGSPAATGTVKSAQGNQAHFKEIRE